MMIIDYIDYSTLCQTIFLTSFAAFLNGNQNILDENRKIVWSALDDQTKKVYRSNMFLEAEFCHDDAHSIFQIS